MDRDEQIQNIKELEGKFLQKAEHLIQNHYLELLFTKYKATIKEIANCYQKPEFSLGEAKECAKAHMQTYQRSEQNFEKLFHFYEVNKRISRNNL